MAWNKIGAAGKEYKIGVTFTKLAYKSTKVQWTVTPRSAGPPVAAQTGTATIAASLPYNRTINQVG